MRVRLDLNDLRKKVLNFSGADLETRLEGWLYELESQHFSHPINFFCGGFLQKATYSAKK